MVKGPFGVSGTSPLMLTLFTINFQTPNSLPYVSLNLNKSIILPDNVSEHLLEEWQKV